VKKDFKNIICQNILLKYLQGKASDEDDKIINNWLNADPQNRVRLEEFKKLWQHAGSISDFKSIDTVNDWKIVRDKIKFEKPADKTTKVIKLRKQIKRVMRVAAVFLLLLGFSYLIYENGNSIFQQEASMLQKSTTNNKTEFILADGTKVHLNKNSELIYPETFKGDKREVKLNGEGFFEVSKNKTKPFIISTQHNAIIKVLGTSFNVNSKDKRVIVQVVEGKVAFYDAAQVGKQEILTKNQQGVLSENTISKSSIDDLNFLSWKTGILKFENEPLYRVIKQLTKHYHTTILLQQKNLESTKITSTFDNQNLTDILDEFSILLNVDYQMKEDSIFIYKSD